MICTHNSCQQQAYGGHTLCYYHRKVAKGLLKVEDRPSYLHSDAEVKFATMTDRKDTDVCTLHKTMETPTSIEIIKLTLYILANQTKQQVSYFKGDVYIALMILYLFDMPVCKTQRDFIQYNAIRISKDLLKRYNKETMHQGKEVSFNAARLQSPSPEEEVIKEQEDHLKYRAFYFAKKMMTRIERKVFSLLEKGEDETFVSNKLHLSRQRVNRLKQKAYLKVRKLMVEYASV